MARPELYAPGLALAMTGGFALYLHAYTGVRFSEYVVALERRGMWSALGFGVFFTIPLLRLAGDHALVAMFTKLQGEDRETNASPASSSSSWVLRHASARGASLPEYVLLLVGVMLVAAGAFRRLGAAASSNASKGAAEEVAVAAKAAQAAEEAAALKIDSRQSPSSLRLPPSLTRRRPRPRSIEPCIPRGATVSTVSGARVVVIEDASMPDGYRILTVFPERP